MLHKNSQSQGRYVKIIRADAEQTRSTDQFQRGEHRQEIKGLLKINETAKQAVELFNKCECVNTCVCLIRYSVNTIYSFHLHLIFQWHTLGNANTAVDLQTDFVEGSQRQRESSLGKSRSQREWFHGKKPNNNSDERRLVSNKL